MLANEINIKNKLYSYYFDNLIKAIKLETKYFHRREKIFGFDVLFYQVCAQNSITMLSLDYHELMINIEEQERTKYLLVEDYMLNKTLDKTKVVR